MFETSVTGLIVECDCIRGYRCIVISSDRCEMENLKVGVYKTLDLAG